MKKNMLLSAGTLIGLLVSGTSYATLYVSPMLKTNNNTNSTSQTFVKFANNVPLSDVIKTLYPKNKIVYFGVDKTQKINWNWSGPSNANPLKTLQSGYGLYIYANPLTRKVGVAHNLNYAKALTSERKNIWSLHQGDYLQPSINTWAKLEGVKVIWQIKDNPKIKKNQVVLGNFGAAINKAININLKGKKALIESAHSNKVFYVEQLDQVKALKPPRHFTNPWLVVETGSLKKQVEKFANKFNYKLIWKVVDEKSGNIADRQWYGNEKISHKKPEQIISSMIMNYPSLMLNIWKANRVICVTNVIGMCQNGELNNENN